MLEYGILHGYARDICMEYARDIYTCMKDLILEGSGITCAECSGSIQKKYISSKVYRIK